MNGPGDVPTEPGPLLMRKIEEITRKPEISEATLHRLNEDFILRDLENCA